MSDVQLKLVKLISQISFSNDYVRKTEQYHFCSSWHQS